MSVSSAGHQALGESSAPSLSADGQVVVFVSAAVNLVPGDTNRKKNIFAHDRATNETTRVSVSSSGQESNADSAAPVVSADGRFVAYESAATNLVSGDTGVRASPRWSRAFLFLRNRRCLTSTVFGLRSAAQVRALHLRIVEQVRRAAG